MFSGIGVVRKIFKNPYMIFVYMAKYNLLNWLSDRLYLKLIYKGRTGKSLNLDDPKTFNEKLQWLKLNDRNLLYTDMVDKLKVKCYVGNLIGKQYVIPTLGTWRCFDDIDFDGLPDKFVLKCTHDSGGIIACKEKSRFDVISAKKKIKKSLRRNYYKYGREYPYKNVEPRIIAEPYLSDDKSISLLDYKFFCFNGKVRITLVCSDRFSELKEDFYDINWNHLNIKRPLHNNSRNGIKKPANYLLMIKLAEKLAKNIPFVRVDFYEINGLVYFGEMTFYPASGFDGFEPEEWDFKLGQWLII